MFNTTQASKSGPTKSQTVVSPNKISLNAMEALFNWYSKFINNIQHEAQININSLSCRMNKTITKEMFIIKERSSKELLR